MEVSKYRLQYLHNNLYFTVSDIKGEMRTSLFIVLCSDDRTYQFSLDFVLELRFIDLTWRNTEDHSFNHSLGKDTKRISLLSPKEAKSLS